MIEDLIIYGLISGAVYSLLALGFTLIYGVADIVNMAHGAFYMLGAYMFYIFAVEYFSLEPFLAVILAVILIGFIGMIVYRVFIDPVLDDIVAIMVVTLGVALVFQQIIILHFTGSDIAINLLSGSVDILGLPVDYHRILAFVVSLVLFAVLWVFIRKSKIGGAMRAVAQDREAAMLMGINTERLYMLTMAISASFAALAGILIAAYTAANPQMWTSPLGMSFAIVVLGGLGSIKGSLVGAFIIGYAEKAVTIWTGMAYLEGATSFVVLVVVLLLKPAGLFGKRREMEE